MYAFLLLLGAVISTAGLALVASAVSVQQHTFDVSDVTPGAIAVVGGCILIALAFVVRALLRVERALMARPVQRPAMRSADAVGPSATAAQTNEPSRIPFPPKPKVAAVPQSAPVSAAARPAPVMQKPVVADSRPSIQEGVENAPLVEGSDVSLLPRVAAGAEDENGQVRPVVAVRSNGVTHAGPRLAVDAQAPQQQQAHLKGSLFDSLWPKSQRAALQIQTEAVVPAAAAPMPLPTAQPVPASTSNSAAAPHPVSMAVSILKSGVVEGMAYTLYSDGSIEAQLPGGTLRFGSITELRNHIEQNS